MLHDSRHVHVVAQGFICPTQIDSLKTADNKYPAMMPVFLLTRSSVIEQSDRCM